MSVVVRPGRFVGEVHPIGKLASTMLSVSIASMAEPGRFRRGRMLQIDGAVLRLEIDAGTVRGTVQGSVADPYTVVVSAPTVDRPITHDGELPAAMVTGLMPRPGELLTSCTCPDPDDPCKHSIAALVALAEQVATQPDLLLAWRCHSPGSAPDARRPGVQPPHLRLAGPPIRGRAPERTASEHPDWSAFVGDTPVAAPLVVPELPAEPASLGAASLGSIDIAEWVRSALAALRDDD